MKKVLTILFFLFSLATATAYGFPWLQNDNGHPVADYSGVTFPLESAPIGTIAAADGKILVIAASDADSENQHKQGHNHDRKAKSKYDLRDLDGKKSGDVHKHGHDHKDAHVHDHGHDHGHGHDHKDAHGHDHGGHDHGHEHGGWEPPEGLYDRLWDVVTLG